MLPTSLIVAAAIIAITIAVFITLVTVYGISTRFEIALQIAGIIGIAKNTAAARRKILSIIMEFVRISVADFTPKPKRYPRFFPRSSVK